MKKIGFFLLAVAAMIVSGCATGSAIAPFTTPGVKVVTPEVVALCDVSGNEQYRSVDGNGFKCQSVPKGTGALAAAAAAPYTGVPVSSGAYPGYGAYGPGYGASYATGFGPGIGFTGFDWGGLAGPPACVVYKPGIGRQAVSC